MLAFKRLLSSVTVIQLLAGTVGSPAVSYGQADAAYRGCIAKERPVTREEIVCRLVAIKRFNDGEVKRLLGEKSTLEAAEVDNELFALQVQSAECEASAVLEFAQTSTDISRESLVAYIVEQPMTDEQFARIGESIVGTSLFDALRRCETAFADGWQRFLDPRQ